MDSMSKEDKKRNYLKPMNQGLITIPKAIRDDFDVDGDEDRILIERETVIDTTTDEAPEEVIEKIRKEIKRVKSDENGVEIDEELIENISDDLVLSESWTIHPFKIPDKS